MNPYKDFRTIYEDKREIKLVKEFFNFEEFSLVQNQHDYLRKEKQKNRNLTIIKLIYNNIESEYYLTGDKVGMFKTFITEEYEVMLKGDMFTIHDRTTGNLTTYNVLDWTILEQRVQSSVNLEKENDRLTDKYIKKLFLY